MLDKELARKIIYNFLKTNPNLTAYDFIDRGFSIKHRTTFDWSTTPEGYNFWYNVYAYGFKRNDQKIKDFLIKYYFDVKNNFIDLRSYI